ncbi:MAG TPA: hypothetical protein PK020_13130 [Ilumatobacteraceae bacterium]|nr:hypothetical protein [Ilumatobacteraceae bacterium]HRB03104.1 hypothetical protein [Ilumatobacteraceae bacterium]
MFTGLIEGARAIRIQLVAGYSALLTAYIALHGVISDHGEWTSGPGILVDLYSSFGAAGRAAFWAFSAFMIGSILTNTFFGQLVERTAQHPNGPSWPDFIDEAKAAVKEYEEYKVTTHLSGNGAGGTTLKVVGRSAMSHTVPSPHHAEFLREVVEDRERRHAEVQFRMAVTLGLVAPGIAMTIRAGWWGLAFLVPTLLVWLDMANLQRKTMEYMCDAREAIARESKSEAEEQLKEVLHRLEANGGQLSKVALADLEAERERLDHLLQDLDQDLEGIQADRTRFLVLRTR